LFTSIKEKFFENCLKLFEVSFLNQNFQKLKLYLKQILRRPQIQLRARFQIRLFRQLKIQLQIPLKILFQIRLYHRLKVQLKFKLLFYLQVNCKQLKTQRQSPLQLRVRTRLQTLQQKEPRRFSYCRRKIQLSPET